MSLKIFDLDGTLIECDSSSQFCQFCVEKGLVEDPDYLLKERQVMQSYSAQKMQIEEYIKLQVQPLLSLTVTQVAVLSDEFVKSRAANYIYQQGKELIQSFVKRGDRVVIVSATAEFIVKAIAKELGVKDVIAIQIESDGEKYTQNVLGTASYREGKVTRLQQWLTSENLDLIDSYFYSDSINDLPLLELVDNPIATNPDDQLKAHAKQRAWPILEF
ncbi:MAG: HAD superfamily hydrolase (TIGR01490 family) [Oceanospirillaceae bacterium]|jgi:HAD superfamily hydrolase (TIGR01490 family)